MFGYVRPLKPELLMREYTRYRSIYCGICKQIGHDYGQLPRLATGYDLTLLALLLLSLSDEQPPDDPAGCILNPLAKKPIARGGPILELGAGLTVLFAWHKAGDQVQDKHAVRGFFMRLAFYRAYRRAKRRYPNYEQILKEELAVLAHIESGPPSPEAAQIFGRLLQRVFFLAAERVVQDQNLKLAIGLIGRDLGKWIYLLDAIDDWADDCNNGNWNPYARLDRTQAEQQAAGELAELELALNRTAALLPYYRDSGILANVLTQGLPAVRQQVMSGQKLGRL
ncbi:MAG: DUF5685 family protein [Clostridiaceae bacterium]|nr:DUF5685 family protein [Clostridiaceae bacterium]